MDILIFTARKEHFKQIMELHKEGLQDTGALSLDTSLDNDLDDLENSYSDGCFIVAATKCQADYIIGMGAIRKISGEHQIKRMRVKKEYRRQGIAQQMLEYLLDYAIEKGVNRLTLDTAESQLAAQKLYEKNGFTHYKNIVIGGVASKLYEIIL